VVYSPEANSDSVAGHTVSLILCLLKRVCFLNQLPRQGVWRGSLLAEKNLNRELKDKNRWDCGSRGHREEGC
jgi:phosphoglycerate dehydrogenase-like enzyme